MFTHIENATKNEKIIIWHNIEKAFWDSNKNPEEILNLFENGNEDMRRKIIVKFFTILDWYEILDILPLNIVSKYLNDKTIKMLFPESTQKIYKDIARIVRNRSISTKLRQKNNGDFCYNHNIRYDNLENILTNKISAFYSINSAKDFVDLWTLSKNFNFSWKRAISETRRDKLHRVTTQTLLSKMVDKIDDISKISDENIFLQDEKILPLIIQDYHQILQDMSKGADNSLVFPIEKEIDKPLNRKTKRR